MVLAALMIAVLPALLAMLAMLAVLAMPLMLGVAAMAVMLAMAAAMLAVALMLLRLDRLRRLRGGRKGDDQGGRRNQDALHIWSPDDGNRRHSRRPCQENRGGGGSAAGLRPAGIKLRPFDGGSGVGATASASAPLTGGTQAQAIRQSIAPEAMPCSGAAGASWRMPVSAQCPAPEAAAAAGAAIAACRPAMPAGASSSASSISIRMKRKGIARL